MFTFQNANNAKILMLAKLKQNFVWGWTIVKVVTNPSKLRNERHRNYFTNIIYRVIMKVRTIGNKRQLTNAPLMLNLGKERFIGNIVLKRSLQMTLMGVKNLVYNKLTRQNIFCFIHSISILVVLTYCYHYSYSYFYYCYYYFYYY